MENAIEVKDLAFQYPGPEEEPEIRVFQNLNLTIEQGSFVAILGRNGCGKSTLAKEFNGINLPSGGAVYVFGLDTAKEENLIPIRRTVGMVFQNPDNQIVASVVEEDVAFAPENLGIEPKEIRRRVDEGDEQAGLAFDIYIHRLKKYIGAYYAVLGRVDAVAFTAGVGENSVPVREAAVAGLEGLGLAVDGELNAVRGQEARLISPADARVAVAVVPTDEEMEIATQTYALVNESGNPNLT